MSRFVVTSRALVLVTVLLSSTAFSQVQWVFGNALPPGQAEAFYPPTAAYPFGAPGQPPLSPILPNAALLPPIPATVAPLVGGSAEDPRNAWIYTTDGSLIAMDSDPNYTIFGFTSPPPLVGTAPIPTPYPPGVPVRVSGLAFDDAGATLWACDNGLFWGMNPLPPFNPTTVPLAIPGLINSATGLGFEASTGTLWACDDLGRIYHFTTAGAPIGPQPVSVVLGINGPLGGLTVDDHNHVGAFAPPLCSAQIPGYHVTVTDGNFLFDAFNAAPPVPLVAPSPGQAWGLAGSPDFQVSTCFGVPGSVCSSGSAPFTGLRQPAITGPGLFNAIRLVNAPPNTNVILMVDLCPAPSCWLGLMMNPFTMSTLGVITTGSGTANVGFFIGGFPAGFQFSHQFAVPDSGAPLGYCFSNVATTTIALP